MYRGKPIGGAKPKPAAPEASTKTDAVKGALKKLKELHEAGRITDAEYQRKRNDLLDMI